MQPPSLLGRTPAQPNQAPGAAGERRVPLSPWELTRALGDSGRVQGLGAQMKTALAQALQGNVGNALTSAFLQNGAALTLAPIPVVLDEAALLEIVAFIVSRLQSKTYDEDVEAVLQRLSPLDSDTIVRVWTFIAADPGWSEGMWLLDLFENAGEQHFDQFPRELAACVRALPERERIDRFLELTDCGPSYLGREDPIRFVELSDRDASDISREDALRALFLVQDLPEGALAEIRAVDQGARVRAFITAVDRYVLTLPPNQMPTVEEAPTNPAPSPWSVAALIRDAGQATSALLRDPTGPVQALVRELERENQPQRLELLQQLREARAAGSQPPRSKPENWFEVFLFGLELANWVTSDSEVLFANPLSGGFIVQNLSLGEGLELLVGAHADPDAPPLVLDYAVALPNEGTFALAIRDRMTLPPMDLRGDGSIRIGQIAIEDLSVVAHERLEESPSQVAFPILSNLDGFLFIHVRELSLGQLLLLGPEQDIAVGAAGIRGLGLRMRAPAGASNPAVLGDLFGELALLLEGVTSAVTALLEEGNDARLDIASLLSTKFGQGLGVELHVDEIFLQDFVSTRGQYVQHVTIGPIDASVQGNVLDRIEMEREPLMAWQAAGHPSAEVEARLAALDARMAAEAGPVLRLRELVAKRASEDGLTEAEEQELIGLARQYGDVELSLDIGQFQLDQIDLGERWAAQLQWQGLHASSVVRGLRDVETYEAEFNRLVSGQGPAMPELVSISVSLDAMTGQDLDLPELRAAGLSVPSLRVSGLRAHAQPAADGAIEGKLQLDEIWAPLVAFKGPKGWLRVGESDQLGSVPGTATTGASLLDLDALVRVRPGADTLAVEIVRLDIGTLRGGPVEGLFKDEVEGEALHLDLASATLQGLWATHIDLEEPARAQGGFDLFQVQGFLAEGGGLLARLDDLRVENFYLGGLQTASGKASVGELSGTGLRIERGDQVICLDTLALEHLSAGVAWDPAAGTLAFPELRLGSFSLTRLDVSAGDTRVVVEQAEITGAYFDGHIQLVAGASPTVTVDRLVIESMEFRTLNASLGLGAKEITAGRGAVGRLELERVESVDGTELLAAEAGPITLENLQVAAGDAIRTRSSAQADSISLQIHEDGTLIAELHGGNMQNELEVVESEDSVSYVDLDLNELDVQITVADGGVDFTVGLGRIALPTLGWGTDERRLLVSSGGCTIEDVVVTGSVQTAAGDGGGLGRVTISSLSTGPITCETDTEIWVGHNSINLLTPESDAAFGIGGIVARDISWSPETGFAEGGSATVSSLFVADISGQFKEDLHLYGELSARSIEVEIGGERIILTTQGLDISTRIVDTAPGRPLNEATQETRDATVVIDTSPAQTLFTVIIPQIELPTLSWATEALTLRSMEGSALRLDRVEATLDPSAARAEGAPETFVIEEFVVGRISSGALEIVLPNLGTVQILESDPIFIEHVHAVNIVLPSGGDAGLGTPTPLEGTLETGEISLPLNVDLATSAGQALRAGAALRLESLHLSLTDEDGVQLTLEGLRAVIEDDTPSSDQEEGPRGGHDLSAEGQVSLEAFRLWRRPGGDWRASVTEPELSHLVYDDGNLRLDVAHADLGVEAYYPPRSDGVLPNMEIFDASFSIQNLAALTGAPAEDAGCEPAGDTREGLPMGRMLQVLDDLDTKLELDVVVNLSAISWLPADALVVPLTLDVASGWLDLEQIERGLAKVHVPGRTTSPLAGIIEDNLQLATMTDTYGTWAALEWHGTYLPLLLLHGDEFEAWNMRRVRLSTLLRLIPSGSEEEPDPASCEPSSQAPRVRLENLRTIRPITLGSGSSIPLPGGGRILLGTSEEDAVSQLGLSGSIGPGGRLSLHLNSASAGLEDLAVEGFTITGSEGSLTIDRLSDVEIIFSPDSFIPVGLSGHITHASARNLALLPPRTLRTVFRLPLPRFFWP